MRPRGLRPSARRHDGQQASHDAAAPASSTATLAPAALAAAYPAALAAALASAALATARAAAALATAARLQYGIEWCRLSWRRVFYRQWLSMPVVECPGTAALSLTDASQIPGQRAGRGAQLLSQPGTKIEYMVATNALVLHAECFSPL